MGRAIWKGAISFGLVYIPVELHSAIVANELDLTMLDKHDFSPIGFRRYNKSTGKEVQWSDIIKGYEYETDEYVVLSDEDLKQANVKATQSIDIQSFVSAEQVPLTYYEQPYYLTPSKGGDKVYALLRETLRKADKVAIAQIVMRTKQHLAALVTVGDVIVLNTLRYAEELRETNDLDIPKDNLKAVGLSEREINMALSLVESMNERWQPTQFHDTYREDVLALVQKKIAAKQTKTITTAVPDADEKPRSAKIIDLVELLQQSLGKTPKAGAARSASEDNSTKPAKTATSTVKTKVAKTKASTARSHATPAKTGSAVAKPRRA